MNRHPNPGISHNDDGGHTEPNGDQTMSTHDQTPEPTASDIYASLERIEAKLDAIIAASTVKERS